MFGPIPLQLGKAIALLRRLSQQDAISSEKLAGRSPFPCAASHSAIPCPFLQVPPQLSHYTPSNLPCLVPSSPNRDFSFNSYPPCCALLLRLEQSNNAHHDPSQDGQPHPQSEVNLQTSRPVGSIVQSRVNTTRLGGLVDGRYVFGVVHDGARWDGVDFARGDSRGAAVGKRKYRGKTKCAIDEHGRSVSVSPVALFYVERTEEPDIVTHATMAILVDVLLLLVVVSSSKSVVTLTGVVVVVGTRGVVVVVATSGIEVVVGTSGVVVVKRAPGVVVVRTSPVVVGTRVERVSISRVTPAALVDWETMMVSPSYRSRMALLRAKEISFEERGR